MRRSLFAQTALLTLTFASFGGVAHAQDGRAVDELIVTAQKRPENRLSAPIAITSFSRDTLNDLGVQDVRDIASRTPGLVVQSQSPANSGYVLRGVTTDDGAATAEPRVAVFQDGVSIAKQRGAFVELFDLERVEVARGPQTTLFGRAALTGAVQYIQNKAVLGAHDARLRLEAGGDGYRVAEGMINAPIGETLAVRAAARYREKDGDIENLLGGPALNSVQTGAARFLVAWRPSSALRSDLIVNVERDTPGGQSTKSRSFYPSDPVTGQILGDLSSFTGAALASPKGFQGDRPMGLRRTIAGVTWLTDYAPGGAWSLSQNLAWRRFTASEIYDLDGFSFPLLGSLDASRYRQYSSETRLNYAGDRLKGFVAASAFFERGQQSVDIQIDEFLLLDILTNRLDRNNPVVGPLAAYHSIPGTAVLLQGLAAASGFTLPADQANAIARNLQTDHGEGGVNGITGQSYDLFGDLSYALTDKLTLSAGLRWSASRKTTDYQSWTQRSTAAGILGALAATGAARSGLLAALSVPGAASIPQSPSYPLPVFGLAYQQSALETNKSRDSGASWRVAASYALADSGSLYASYARGQRPEVVSPNTPRTPGGAVVFKRVSPETLDSLEIGAKGRFSTVVLESAAYAYRYRHFQTTVQQGTQFFTDDAGRADAYGAEFQARWTLATWVDLHATYAYAHARFQTGLYQGNHLRLAPDHTVSLDSTVSWPLAGGTLAFAPSWSWRSHTYFNDDNDNPALQTGTFVPVFRRDKTQDSYGLLDARLRWIAPGRNWSMELFGRNLLDRHYLRDAGNSGDDFGLPTYVPGESRLVGIAMTVRPGARRV
ncbi:TonB-dependent receptor [Caulobacter sp. FWC2]|uniref:TonB-dependent receptor n=1 Tax=Caulobacter sp. FWC2 TaxID=69664 RepID=UPI000C151199|nr:TonB-dependent receptor [Caulobacter sp. FWC2]PIB91627.1 TonB-dependent receptor [Caulobacter sp. FWC2]